MKFSMISSTGVGSFLLLFLAEAVSSNESTITSSALVGKKEGALLRGVAEPDAGTDDITRDLSRALDVRETAPSPWDGEIVACTNGAPTISDSCKGAIEGMMYHVFASVSKNTGNCLSEAEHNAVARDVRDALKAANFQQKLAGKMLASATDATGDYKNQISAGYLFDLALKEITFDGWMDRYWGRLHWTMFWCDPVYSHMLWSTAKDVELFGALRLHTDHEPHFAWMLAHDYDTKCPQTCL
uniref:Phospholipase B-like n=1 Tax=Pseudictyota dubia TaxID=2749911 RepID=A0A7R9WEY1_9STRA|mmetsp:Transcript_45672/g.84757  ORF Transcript_45672/g.84757 Transcript_45672/m.84757 type:complete len:242 (+) Transcript_45672:98-823(+)